MTVAVKSRSSKNTTFSKDETVKLINESKLNKPLIEKAVKALLKHHGEKVQAAEKIDLLGADTAVQVQIGLEIAPLRPSPKPVRILIPHSINHIDDDDEEDLDEPQVCLIVKEEAKPWVQEMIQQYGKHMKLIKKVLGLESLRKKHVQYQQRRELLHKYTHFMADDRILPMLTKALGKDFFKAKKQPIPVKLTRKESLPLAILSALKSTFMTIPEGTCVTIKAGYTHMPIDKLVENIVATAEGAIPKLPRKWANVRSIAVKTTNSTSLPFYNKTPEEIMEIAAMAGLPSVWKEDKEGDQKTESSDDVEKEKKRKLASKSPLVRALKKQKKQEEQTLEDNDEAQESAKSSKESKKARKKQRSSESVKGTDVDKESGLSDAKKKQERKDVAKLDLTEKDGSASKKKRKISGLSDAKKKQEQKDVAKLDLTEKDDCVSATKKKRKIVEHVHTEEKADRAADKESGRKTFIASKKYKGSENGYVFRNGDEGVGYYIDVKPVVDKMKIVEHVHTEEKADRAADKESGRKTFIASKKYKGSKNGYVFRNGDEGVGYYIDVKPVVDKMALAAIARMAQQGKGGRKSKGTKRRGRR